MPSANSQTPTASTSGTHIPTWTGTNAQADEWIKNGLGITDPKTIARLKSQGISTPADLFELEEDDITALSNAMSSKVYNDDGTVAAKPCTLHWRQLKRIRNYAALADYCSTVRRNISPADVSWENVVRGFTDELKILTEKKKAEAKDAPVLKSGTPMTTFLRRLENHLSDQIGVLGTTCEYLIWLMTSPLVDTTAPDQAPALQPGTLHAATRTSIADEIKARVSRTDPRVKQDDESLFNDLVTALKGTQYEGLAAPFRPGKEGAKFYHLLKSTHGHDEIQETEFDKYVKYFQSARWSGKNDGELSALFDKLRAILQNMKEIAATCPNVTLPTERQLVKYLLDIISCKEAEMVAYLAQVKIQDGTGKDYRNNFEEALSYLATAPYEGKGKPSGRKRARFATPEISVINADQDDNSLDDEARYQASLKLNGGIGKTDVELRYHKAAEFKKLTRAQRKELLEWRERELVKMGFPAKKRGQTGGGKGGKRRRRRGGGGGGGAGGGSGGDQKQLRSQISALQSQLDKLKKETPPKSDDTISQADLAAAVALINRASAQASVSGVNVNLNGVVAASAATGEEVSAATIAATDASEKDLDAQIAEAQSCGVQEMLKICGKQEA